MVGRWNGGRKEGKVGSGMSRCPIITLGIQIAFQREERGRIEFELGVSLWVAEDPPTALPHAHMVKIVWHGHITNTDQSTAEYG